MSGPRVGALFAGYGGLEMAAAMTWPDATLAWVSEIDDAACTVLAAHAPDVPNLGDITAIDWTEVEPVDIITGGSPCQDLSLAGRRAGMMPGTRSGLWAAMCRAIETLRPSLVIWENVSGSRSAPAVCDVEPCPGCVGDRPADTTVRALGRVLGDLATLGLDAEWVSVRASDVGACHQRERVFVLAWPATDTTGYQGWVGHRDGPSPADAGQLRWVPWRQPTTRQAASGRTHNEPRGRDRASLNLLPTPTATAYGRQQSPSPGAVIRPSLSTLARSELLPTPTTSPSTGNGHARNLGAEAKLLPTPSAADGGGGHASRSGARSDELLLPGIAKEAARTGFGPYRHAIDRWAAVIGRQAPHPTTETGGLSPRFVEWMMGLPDGWVTATDLSASRMKTVLGNGVVPKHAAYAIRLLLDSATGEQVTAA